MMKTKMTPYKMILVKQVGKVLFVREIGLNVMNALISNGFKIVFAA